MILDDAGPYMTSLLLLLLDSKGRAAKKKKSDSCRFLPLSSLSSRPQAQPRRDTIYCMCIILLSPAPQGNG